MEEYLVDLKERIEGKHMDDIWVMAERVDFKPMKGYTKTSIQEMFKENIGHYAGKLVANIQIFIYPKKKQCITLKVHIYTILDNGNIDKSISDNWGATVHYHVHNIEKRKFFLKDVEQLMRWVADRKVITDTFVGLSLDMLSTQFKKHNLRFE